MSANASSTAAALDLGSTRIKLALGGDDGRLGEPRFVDAPALAGEQPVREFEADEYRARVEKLLAQLPQGARLAIASQRSTFVLWERANGRPVRRAISWADRAAADWCAAHEELGRRIPSMTGLLLSPHYVGPKLARLLELEPTLARRMRRREVLFGTLETYLLWHWSAGAAHETDASMAARTLLADARDCVWSSELCDAFGVPREALPSIVPTSGRDLELSNGLRLVASLSDQAASVLAMLPRDDDSGVLINLGTGSFALRPTASSFSPTPGLLAGPIHADAHSRTYALEGTLNAGGATLARLGPPEHELASRDEFPDAFCLPDENGIGAPHWLPTRSFELSPAARALTPAQQRAIVLEGLTFRLRELIEALFPHSAPNRVVLSGGLAHDPVVAATLAAVLSRPIELSTEPESTLLATARLAAGLAPFSAPATQLVSPAPQHAWLAAKYAHWRTWLASTLLPQPPDASSRR